MVKLLRLCFAVNSLIGGFREDRDDKEVKRKRDILGELSDLVSLHLLEKGF